METQTLTVNKAEATLLTLLILRAQLITEEGLKKAEEAQERDRWIEERELINGLKRKIDRLETAW